ncbi:type II toxin-antitoxin system VapC family toxin [Geoglobus acetivorans]|uniref:Ribonuclease VapC n=1 Tax=Geoglobus acetivorans TaxID=565033 RepID=A0A0A7GB61_GEOAI|nr:VapC toxin protein [Geoglobus acetivorans]
MEICLDTDVLIDFLRGKGKIVEVIKKLEEEHELLTTSINIFELYYGAYRTGRERNVNAVDELADRLEILKLTERSAKISGRILAELESDGRAIDFRDILIAGIVIENEAALFTGNKKHFQRVKGLKLFEIEE